MNRLKEKYFKEVIPAMEKEFNYRNPMAVPKISQVVINIGTSRALKDPKVMEVMKDNLTMISGQKPISTRARKAISGFNIKENMVVGLKVTLRGKRMYDFLDKFINIALPRVRDFRGLSSKSFDQRGNLTIGVKECSIFPEIDASKAELAHGLEVCVTTTAKDRDEGYALLKLLGFPLRER